MWHEMFASEGFGKNLQKNLIRLIFFNFFPKLVHKWKNRHDNRGNREKARNEALTKVTSEALRGTKLRRRLWVKPLPAPSSICLHQAHQCTETDGSIPPFIPAMLLEDRGEFYNIFLIFFQGAGKILDDKSRPFRFVLFQQAKEFIGVE